MTRLAFVYLGDHLPAYVCDNVRRTRRLFANCEVVLITDSARVERKVRGTGVTTYRLIGSDWQPDSLITNAVPFDHTFRDAFWLQTLRRFWALAAYHRSIDYAPLLHVESDVLLMRSFDPKELAQLIQAPLAFGLLTPTEGIASLLFMQGISAIELLSDAADEMVTAGDMLTDMTLLMRIWQRDERQVTILPSVPQGALNTALRIDARLQNTVQATGSTVPGIYDAATLGQYLFGTDPRNERGWRGVFNSPAHHLLDPQRLTFQLHSGGELVVRTRSHDSESVIHTLHVHSKDRRVFRQPERILARRIRQLRKGPRREFVPLIFLALVIAQGTRFIAERTRALLRSK